MVGFTRWLVRLADNHPPGLRRRKFWTSFGSVKKADEMRGMDYFDFLLQMRNTVISGCLYKVLYYQVSTL